MDNDTLRRGRPTLHVVYGDGIAILAGDGLQAEAFALLAREPATATIRRSSRGEAARRCASSADAAGPAGMVGGQAIDLQAAGQAPGHALDARRRRAARMHARKTGALIRASAVSGAIMAGGADERWSTRSIGYAAEVGLAFQIVDDILDVEGDAAELGKTAGKDAAGDKPTYPALFGLERSRALAAECLDARAATPARRAAARRRLAAAPIADWVVDTQELTVMRRHACRPIDRPRLDVALVERGLAASRERARALILAGQVARRRPGRLEGRRAGRRRRARRARRRPIIRTSAAAASSSRTRSTRSASTAPAAARSTSARRPAASPTCCCSAAPRASIALDVGHGQLDWRLRNDPRVVVREGVNARALTPARRAASRSTS